MNLDLILAIIFYGVIFLLFLTYKNKFEVQNKIFILYKTKFGLKSMDYLSKKFPKLLKLLSYVSITVGFAGMIFIFYILIQGTFNLIIKPASTPVLSPVLPGIKIPGLPVLSFWHWIISILFIAVIHEFCHGIYARLSNIKIKSSGFAFLGPILAAFVEPDEKQMEKKKIKEQLSVLSAGPFSNIFVGVIILVASIFFLSPIASSITYQEGVKIVDIPEGYPLSKTSINAGETIEEINNIKLNHPEDFVTVLNSFSPGERINIKTNKTTESVILTEHPKNSSMPYLGVLISPVKVDIKENIKEKYPLFPKLFFWITTLIFWLYAINIGVGLFNLLPLGPVDGGKMFYLLSLSIFKNKIKAKKIYHLVSLICLTLIFINLLPYLIKLINFIFAPILAII